MECIICGAALPENANFCPVCGTACQHEPAPETPEILPVPEAPAQESAPAPDFVLIEEPAAPAAEAVPCELPPEEPEQQEPVPVRPRKRRAVLVPVLMMALMLVVGTVCFFLLPSEPPEVPESTNPAVGQPEDPGLPLPPGKTEDESLRSDEFVPADEDCFRMTAEGIEFLAQKYDGGKILVIPNEIDGKTVTAIAPHGFTDCTGISTVILPDTLETIGEGAFAGCTDIRGIWFPESMRRVGDGAFRDCIGLESVAVQKGMEYIGTEAFTGCARLFYFFYDGDYEQWVELYNEYVTPFTSVTCQDGDYYHGVEMP